MAGPCTAVTDGLGNKMKASEEPRQRPEYKPLDTWLEVATSGLPAEDTAGVRSEIVDRFQEDTDDGLRAGLAVDAAAKAAVENLGPPEVSSRVATPRRADSANGGRSYRPCQHLAHLPSWS